MSLRFFDNSFVDCSLKTRYERQIRQISDLLSICIKHIKLILQLLSIRLFYILRYLKSLFYRNKFSAVSYENVYDYGSTRRTMSNTGKEDLTIDGYIDKHGGIESHLDNKVYTTKQSYLDHIKDKGCVIKDY